MLVKSVYKDCWQQDDTISNVAAAKMVCQELVLHTRTVMQISGNRRASYHSMMEVRDVE